MPGVPAIVIKPETINAAYGLRNLYRSSLSMAFFPAEALVRLYEVLGDIRELMSWLALATQGLVVLAMLIGLGLPREYARAGAVFGIIAYGLWLHWFVTRHGLGLSGLRAALLVLGVNVATVVIVMGPRMLALATGTDGLGGK